jgi:hypothetical protein
MSNQNASKGTSYCKLPRGNWIAADELGGDTRLPCTGTTIPAPAALFPEGRWATAGPASINLPFA